ncbi:hypothetical protein [Ectobacillus panaciterrae]|uniref:hypothetical protein n=1 Tax=Ectobacillus panaciterrae TaxID=363872 RepID=UPI00042A8041|nr:hypothetical protein [Ectobacillus panaciterrae]
MSLKKLFFFTNKNSNIEKKLESLEQEIKRLSLLQQQGNQVQPPVVIEKVNIEKIAVDKFELNNNFGQLGIKELKGRLNIGATYGGDSIWPEDMMDQNDEKDKVKKDERKEKTTEKKPADGPKINIQPRKSK